MMTLHILFVSLLFLSSVRPFLQENFYNSEIPFLNGTGCLESSPTQDLKIAWLEITWRLINFKEYYRICQTLKRPFQILHQFQLPADKYGKSHFVDLIFRLAPPGFFLFCGSYTPCSSGDFLQDTVEMVIHDGQRSVDMFATGYEYEADLTYSTVNGVIKTSIGRATKSPQYGIIFKLGGDINRTEFQTVLQPPITENLLQLYFVVKQWRNPDPVSMMELETNCNLQTL
ncbi:uncharacterized protein LOC110846155 [Folsomia candida]|nr:uncharacterized protein LOC110846155 [Folsomia candida]